MADIPTIDFTSGQGTPAPVAAQNTINPLVSSVNTLNDTTIPGIQTNITALQASVQGLATSSQLVYASNFPGIDKTGLTASNTGLTNLFASIAGTGKIGIIDCPVYIQTGTTGQSIFVSSGVNLEFKANGRFILDAVSAPALAFIWCKNCTWLNYTVAYIGNFGGTCLQYTGTWATNNGNWNTTVLTNYLSANNGNTFTGGATANYFIGCLFSFNVQWNTGVAVNSSTTFNNTNSSQPNSILFDGFTVDGCCMGFVGTGANLRFRRGLSLRYGDLEDAQGNNQGGIDNTSGRSGNLSSGLWFAPPHLFYLQSQTANFLCSVDYDDIIDEGIYTTSSSVPWTRRTQTSGFINMMKLDCSNVTTVNNLVCKRPDGFADILGQASGTIGAGCFMNNVEIYMDCSVGAYSLLTSGAAAGATSFTITPTLWPYNGTGTTYSGVNSGTYLTVFSTGETRQVTYTVTTSGNAATAVSGTWTQPLLNNNTATIKLGVFGRFAFRFPNSPMNDVYFQRVSIIDQAAIPFNWPMQSDASQAHVNLYADISIIVQDWPAVATYAPGYGLSGTNISRKGKTIFNACSSTQTIRGPITNNTATATYSSYCDEELIGWRQVPITFSGAPTGTSGSILTGPSGVTGWIYTSGVYPWLFSDGEVRWVTCTNGSASVSWTGALTGTPTVNATASNLNYTQLSSNQPRIQMFQTGAPANINSGNRARIVDVSNGWETEVAQGLQRISWTQFYQGTPTGATPIQYPANWGIDQASYGVITALTGGTAPSINVTSGGNTVLSTLPLTAGAPATGAFSPVPYAGALTYAPASGTLPTAGTAVLMTRASAYFLSG